MQKIRGEIKCTVKSYTLQGLTEAAYIVECTIKSYTLHGLTEAAYIVECVFLISIQLSSISLDVSQPWQK